MTTEVTKEEWIAWRNDKVTLQFLSSAMNQRDLVGEAVLQGVVGGEDRLIHIGKCQGIQALLSIALENFDYIKEDENDAASDFLQDYR